MEVNFLKTVQCIPACKTDVKPNIMVMMMILLLNEVVRETRMVGMFRGVLANSLISEGSTLNRTAAE